MENTIVDGAFDITAKGDILQDVLAPVVELSEIALREEMTVYFCTTNVTL